MTFWLAVAILTAAVTYAVTWPLLATDRNGEPSGDQPDTAVYKSQLSEIEADRQRGILDDTEAGSARTEVARRLLHSLDATQTPAARASEGRPKPALMAYAATTVAIPLCSLGLYLLYGAPGQPSRPYAERVATPPAIAAETDLIARVEQRLRDHPDDAKGWDVIGPVYLSQGRHDDAAEAFQKALQLSGESAARLSGFADARIRAENGMVPADARRAVERLIAIDPKRLEPRVWLALAKEQDGDLTGSVAELKSALDAAAVDAPWKPALEVRIKTLEDRIRGATAPAVGPLAINPNDSEQRKIDGMVAQLAERLKSDGGDLNGWLKLVRAYTVLGRADEARTALAEARRTFANDKPSLARLDEFENSLRPAGPTAKE